MFRTLHHATLKSGERLRVARLEAPAGRYATAIRRLLEHKGQPWMSHVDLANRGEVDALRTTYTVGLLGSRFVGNVMIVGDGRAGILGHVFTDPAHRREDICRHLMAAAVDGFRHTGGLALCLGTGYESPPYRIYRSFGFRGIEPGSGHMLFESRPGDLARYFAPAPVRVTDVRWEHWAGLSLLTMQPVGDAIRSVAYGIFGPVGCEGAFLRLQAQRAEAGAKAKALVTSGGSVVGAAILQRDARWPGHVHILDLFVHPNFHGTEELLLRAVGLPRRAKIQAYVDRPSTRRAAALRRQGFRHEATLQRHLLRRGRRHDVLVYSRHT